MKGNKDDLKSKEGGCCQDKGDDCCKNTGEGCGCGDGHDHLHEIGEHEHKEDSCGCGHSHGEGHGHSKYSVEDIAYNNHFVINALVGLLIEKKLISEKDLESALKKIVEHEHNR